MLNLKTYDFDILYFTFKIKAMTQKELEQKAQKYAHKIVKLPFVRAVCLTGSVACGRANENSDIDLLIIVKPGQIYLARAIAVIAAKLWGEYRSDTKIAGKLCLNWFITAPVRANFQFSIHNFHSIFNSQFSKGIKKKRVGGMKLLTQRDQENIFEKLLYNEIGNAFEQLAKTYQIWRIKKDLRTHLHGSEVRWSDEELGFHPRKG